MNQEWNRVAKSADWYTKDQLNFDRDLVRFRFLTFEKHLDGGEGLELGSGDGSMTKFLRQKFRKLTVVDGAQHLLDQIPEGPDLTKVYSLFEEFNPAVRFDAIIMEHVLEHVADPVALLKTAKDWLNTNGIIVIGVPNANSFHRLVAVKMGLLESPFELNDRDAHVGHRRVYSRDSLITDVDAAGLKIKQMDGVFFKPLSNGQIDLYWTPEMIEGFFQLGKDFPENAAEISLICGL